MNYNPLRAVSELIAFEDEIANLREQFYVTLRAYMARIEAEAPPESPALLRAQELLAVGRRPRWSDCYEIEQLLVHLFDEPMLRTELRARLLEAQSSLSPKHYGFYASEVQAAGDDLERLRTVLARLVNDLQWRYTIEEGKRRFSKSLTTRSGVAFLLALSGFAAFAAATYVNDWHFKAGDLRLLVAAAVAGTWGATFSMLTGLSDRIKDSRIYDLNVSRAITMIVARALVGAGAASVLFMFFCSGILTGKAFPELANLAEADVIAKPTVALLVIWCFIAGFSEKLVPNLLAKTEASAKAQTAEPSGDTLPAKYRPIDPPRPAPQAEGARAGEPQAAPTPAE